MPWTRQIFAQFLFQEPYRQRRVTSHLAFQRTKLWLGICGIWGIASFLAPPILQSVAAIEIPTFHELRTSPKSLFRFIWAHLSCPCQHPLRHGEKRRDDVIKPKMSSSHKNKQWISHVFPDFLMKHIFRFAHLWFGSGFPRNFCRRCIGKHRFHRNFHWRDPLQCKKYDKQFHHRDCTLIRFILKLFAWNNFGFSPYAAFLWRTFAIVSVILPRTKPLGPTFGFASKVATFIARNATGQVSFESLRGFDWNSLHWMLTYCWIRNYLTLNMWVKQWKWIISLLTEFTPDVIQLHISSHMDVLKQRFFFTCTYFLGGLM